MLILDIRPARATDDWPRAEPEEQRQRSLAIEMRQRRLHPKQLRLKEGARCLLRMGDQKVDDMVCGLELEHCGGVAVIAVCALGKESQDYVEV